MPYADLNTIHNPATGTVAPATWGDQVRANDEWHIDPPNVSVFHSTTQSLTTATTTTLSADSENYDNYAMHSTSINNSRLTAPTDTGGRYLCVATVTFAANSTNARQLEFRTNGSTSFGSVRHAASSSGDTVITGTRVVTLAVGDYVEVRAFQNSGGNLDVTLVEFVAYYMGRN